MITCRTCRHYQPLPEPAVGGLCRHSPPVATVLTRFRPGFGANVAAWPNESATAWPPVDADRDYCAAYAPTTHGA